MLLGISYCKAKKLLLHLSFILRCQTHATNMRLLSMGEEKAQVLLDRVEALVDCFHDDASLAKEALSESIRYRHPAYDMFYLVLARRTGATLFTLDKKMWALARDMHVNCIEEADLAEATA